MQDKILSLLGLASRAGRVAAGGFSAEEAVRGRKARLLILAEDTQTNTAKKFNDKCSYYKVPILTYGTKETLGHALGKEARACVAVTDRGFAKSILEKAQEAGLQVLVPPDRGMDSSRAAPDGAESGD
ncbi:MAG: ribosomal L7Ae/L30e/S12e/Gadd45 family protein [Lachnospiraceae bacterium]|nr:50S ribosomal protein L7ae [Sarcina sp.]MBQ6590518.1 ribosomal L7Ae/L30e/S12e/Gadd45 family protein [Lachnospiraceae bacterium]